MAVRTLIGLVAVLWPLPVLAGIEPFFENEPRVWTDHSVVYAQVVSVTAVKAHLARLTLAVKATLTGPCDAAEQAHIEADLPLGKMASAIEAAPRPKSRVVVLLMRWPNGKYLVRGAVIEFMPNRAAILEVKSFEDPKVEQVLARLRELRAPKPALETKESKGK